MSDQLDLLREAQRCLSFSSPMSILYQNGNTTDHDKLTALALEINAADHAIRAYFVAHGLALDPRNNSLGRADGPVAVGKPTRYFAVSAKEQRMGWDLPAVLYVYKQNPGDKSPAGTILEYNKNLEAEIKEKGGADRVNYGLLVLLHCAEISKEEWMLGTRHL